MNAKLYVYAFSILIATVIQVLLPVPWLRSFRGDGHLQMVLDWRDPAVKRVFVLMVPVTLGLGLINVNAVIDVFFASRYINPTLAPTAIQKAFLIYMLPQGMFSVAIATVLFPSLSRFASRGDMVAFRRDREQRAASDRVPAHPGSRGKRRTRRADRAHPLPARAVPSAADTGRRGCARGVQRGSRLQRRDADDEPRLLQPAVELGADVDRAREPLPQRDPRCSSLPRRRVGNRARDRDLQCRGDGGAARAAPAADRTLRGQHGSR